MIRILLADDHALMRRGLRRVLEQQPDFEIVGEADDGRQAVQLAEARRPDVGRSFEYPSGGRCGRTEAPSCQNTGVIPRTMVRTDGTRFVLDGEDFPVVGVNCYFLSYCGDGARRQTLDAIQSAGANVIRAAGFLNLAGQPATGPSFQYASGGRIVINDGPDGLERLDALVEAAEERALRLILPLVNYWDDLGGMRTYLQWLFPGRNLRAEEFYRRPEARSAFREWIGHLLNRVNSRTLRPYRNSPAILAWELANEPRCPVPGGRELLLDWAADMSRFAKEQDPNHLVALGDEGFLCRPGRRHHLYSGRYGVDFEAVLRIPYIDFGTYHFYPARGQMNTRLDFGPTWIADHIACGNRANKPVILEEYGIRIGDHGVTSTSERDQWYRIWLKAVHEGGGAGDLLWMIGSREGSVAGNRDAYTIFEASEVPSLAAHAVDMRRRALRMET